MRVRTALVALALALGVLLSGCGFKGVVTLPLPGRVGVGADSYQFSVQLPDVGTLVPNSEVKVDDVTVGTVTHLEVDDWHALATVSLEDSTRLSTDSTAKVGYTSLLGSAYLELDPGTATTLLRPGAVLPLAQGGTYPTTEQVLAATSVLLNGSGLEQVKTITGELDNALADTGHGSVKTLLPRLDSFVGALDDQRQDILTAVDRLDRLGRAFRARIGTVDTALDHLEPALRVLSNQRVHLTGALVSLDHLSSVATDLIHRSQTDLAANLSSLRPLLHRLLQSGDNVVKGLRYLLTPPFAPQGVANACRGDYCNLFLRLDLSLAGLEENFGGPTDTGGGGLIPPIGLVGGAGQTASGLVDGLTHGLPGTGNLPLNLGLDDLGLDDLGLQGLIPHLPRSSTLLGGTS